MATTFSGTFSQQLSITLAKSVDSVGQATYVPADFGLNFSMPSGVTAIFIDKRTVASGADDDIDMVGGLTDFFGAAITPTKLFGFTVRNLSDADRIQISDAGQTWMNDDQLTMRAEGAAGEPAFEIRGVYGSPWTLAAGTADIFRVKHLADTAAAVNYRIALLLG